MQSHSDQERRGAENQAMFREVNDRIEELNRHFDLFTPYGSWACECARLDCVERIDMTLGEYEELRQAPERFAVAPSDAHVFVDFERVVVKNERYWVVEKIGVAAERAAELHHRPSDADVS